MTQYYAPCKRYAFTAKHDKSEDRWKLDSLKLRHESDETFKKAGMRDYFGGKERGMSMDKVF